MFRTLLLALAAISAFAQTLPPGVKKLATVEGLTEYSYPNGLRVILFPDASNPKVTVNMTILVGSRHEGYGETGMAHLLEHMLFMKTSTGRDIKKELTGHGAQWNGTTSNDRTNYFETVTASDENLRWALGLEADRMVHSIMDKKMLDTEMTVVRNEFERGENSPDRVLRERVMATAFLWHNYGKSTIGARADIENVPIDRLAAFYQKYYQPDNAVLIVAGQLDEAKTLKMIAETAGATPRPTRKLDQTYTVEPVQDGERYVSLRRVGDGQSIMAVYHIPAAGHPDSVALEVLSGIMTGGGRGGGGVATGRLSKALVDNKKAVSARMSAESQHDPGVISVSAQLSKEQSLAEARKVMLEVVENLAAEPPTKEEVERVKTRLLRSMEMQMANSQSVAMSLTETASAGDWRLLFLNRDRIQQVTAEDVTRVAKKYLIASNRTIGEFIPESNPVRAEVPATPDLQAVFKDYKGGAGASAGESFDPTPANVEKRLKREQIGGIKMVTLPRKVRGGTVSAVLELHFGDESALSGKTAAAQIAGGLLMRGTMTKTREQIQDAMDKLKSRVMVSGGGGGGFAGGRRGGRGGGGAVSTVADATASIETNKDNLSGALRLAVEMLREPKFSESDFEQVRQQRIAGIENGRSEPATLAALELSRRLSPYAKGDVRYVASIDEQIAELKKVTLDDVKKFHQQFYGASHGELVLVGDFDQDAARKVVTELLGSWKSGSSYRRMTALYKKTERVNLKIETPDKENSQFEAGLRIQLSDDDPDYPALMLANAMFGGTLGARMPNRIRNVEGLSYGVSSRLTVATNGASALFSATAISAPANTPKVEASFMDELRKTLKSGFTQDEVDKQKKAYRDQQIVSRSQEQGLMVRIASLEQQGRTMKWDEQMDAKVQALTLEQVNAAFRKRIDPDSIAIVKAGDFQKAGAYK